MVQSTNKSTKKVSAGMNYKHISITLNEKKTHVRYNKSRDYIEVVYPNRRINNGILV